MSSADIIERIDVTDNRLQFMLAGELDLIVAPGTCEKIVAVSLDKPRPQVVVDLRAVEFVDSAGLALLVFLHKSQPTAGKLSVVVKPGSQPERVLHLGQFHTVLAIHSQSFEMTDV
jgi:anti-anti-sigma factor